jgi:hypothetical protein
MYIIECPNIIIANIDDYVKIKWHTENAAIHIASDTIGAFVKEQNVTLPSSFLTNNNIYLHSLTNRELFILASYTHTGDKLINKYILFESNKDKYGLIDYVKSWNSDKMFLTVIDHLLGIPAFVNPLFFQLKKRMPSLTFRQILRFIYTEPRDEKFINMIIDCISEYAMEFKNIVNKAPKLTDELIVYRGVETQYYSTDGKNFESATYISTSIDPNVSIRFSKATTGCCVKKMILKPGTRAIFMQPISRYKQEAEVLIPAMTKLAIINEERRMYYEYPRESPIDCFDEGREILITTMTT